MKKISLPLVFLTSLVLSLILYGNTIKGDFVYDDRLVDDREELRRPEYLTKLWLESYTPGNSVAGSYRPFTVFTFSLNYILFGESPVSFHIVNILLNALVVILVYIFVLRLFKDHRLAIITSLIFAFLPIHTEAVASIKSRDELLATIFILWSWLLFLKAAQKPNVDYKLYLVSVFLFFLGVMSKEFVIVAPFIFVATLWIREKIRFKKLALILILYGVVAAFYLWMRYQALGSLAFGRDQGYFVINPLITAPLLTKIATSPKLLFLYIQKIVLPFNLSATYAFNHLKIVTNPFTSFEALAGVFLFGLGIVAVIRKKIRETPIAYGAVIFLGFFIMYSKILFQGGDIFAERWMYMPSIGLSLILGYPFLLMTKYQREAAVVFLVALLGFYGYITIKRNEFWLTQESLAQSMIKDAPGSIQGYSIMAEYLIEKGRNLALAKPYVDKGMAIYKDHPPLLESYATILVAEGNFDDGQDTILKAIEIRPRATPQSLLLYALTLTKQGKYKESTDVLTHGVFYITSKVTNNRLKITLDKAMGPLVDRPTARFLLSVNYYKLGNEKEAKKYFDWNLNLSDEEKIRIIEKF